MASSSPPTLYFAYGSNLSPTQMAARCPSSRLIGVGQLIGYRWLINARGYANVVDSSRLRGLRAPRTESNVVLSAPGPDKQARVSPSVANEATKSIYGLVYSLPPDDEKRLDRAEGVPFCYGKEWLSVQFWPLDPEAPLARATSTEKVKGLGKIVDPYLPGNVDTKDKAASSPVPPSSDIRSDTTIPQGRAFVNGQGEPRWALVYVDRERITTSPIQPEYIARMWRGVMEAEQRGVPAEWMEKVIVPALEGEVLKD